MREAIEIEHAGQLQPAVTDYLFRAYMRHRKKLHLGDGYELDWTVDDDKFARFTLTITGTDDELQIRVPLIHHMPTVGAMN